MFYMCFGKSLFLLFHRPTVYACSVLLDTVFFSYLRAMHRVEYCKLILFSLSFLSKYRPSLTKQMAQALPQDLRRRPSMRDSLLQLPLPLSLLLPTAMTPTLILLSVRQGHQAMVCHPSGMPRQHFRSMRCKPDNQRVPIQ